jgi:hypothetical protein
MVNYFSIVNWKRRLTWHSFWSIVNHWRHSRMIEWDVGEDEDDKNEQQREWWNEKNRTERIVLLRSITIGADFHSRFFPACLISLNRREEKNTKSKTVIILVWCHANRICLTYNGLDFPKRDIIWIKSYCYCCVFLLVSLNQSCFVDGFERSMPSNITYSEHRSSIASEFDVINRLNSYERFFSFFVRKMWTERSCLDW